MNFFEHQDQARTSTTKLVLLFGLAVVSLIGITSYLIAILFAAWQQNFVAPISLTNVMRSDILFHTATVILSVIVIGAVYRMIQLRSGGSAVAERMGGRLLNRDLANLDELKILNVVEEMALASGVPVPPVYVIGDDAINAFAAGFHPQDAVIGITRGAIRYLDRDELQGIVAHEFSHIFNGDMRMNLRLVGWLHGLLLIGLIGRQLLHTRVSFREDGKDKTAVVILSLGLGLLLLIVGYTGVFFGNLIKSAVSRQREFLADASAVQFTRNPDGIGNALKKIGGYPLGSRLLMKETSEINHMFIAEGVMKRNRGGWMAMHPTLEQRIRRIEPRWDGKLINPEKERQISYSSLPDDETTAAESVGKKVNSAEALASVLVAAAGTMSTQSLRLVQKELAGIPAAMRQQLSNALEASLLMYGVLIAQSQPSTARKQLELLQQQLPPASFRSLAAQLKELVSLPRSLDLTLIELAHPALKQLSAEQLRGFLGLIARLISIDGEVTLQEWAFGRLLAHHLEPAYAGNDKSLITACSDECRTLLSALAQADHGDAEAATAAYAAACSAVRLPSSALQPINVAVLDVAIGRLMHLKPLQKPLLLKAMVVCVQHDGKLTQQERDLLRVIAAVMDCPLPPL
ncbi:MAG: M48 family metallopeptidase [Pseudomonadota bacterium]